MVSLNEFEAGEGLLVILLHDFPECWASWGWGPQITFLIERGYRVAVPEMRGYGESDAPTAVAGRKRSDVDTRECVGNAH